MTSHKASGDDDRGARRRVLATLGLIVLAALSTIRWPIKTLGQVVRAPGGSEVTQFLARCERLAPSLPPSGRIGYVVNAEEAESRESFHRARLALLQYALAPRLIERFSGHELVVFDSDEPAAFPAATECRDWQMVSDLHDGLKLYRTAGRK